MTCDYVRVQSAEYSTLAWSPFSSPSEFMGTSATRLSSVLLPHRGWMTFARRGEMDDWDGNVVLNLMSHVLRGRVAGCGNLCQAGE